MYLAYGEDRDRDQPLAEIRHRDARISVGILVARPITPRVTRRQVLAQELSLPTWGTHHAGFDCWMQVRYS